MKSKQTLRFSSEILIIGINPYVMPPEPLLRELFAQAKKETSPIPIEGTLNGTPFKQNLVRYQGAWRLYLNGPMRKAAGIDVGDQANLEISFDSKPRIEPSNQKLLAALSKNKNAQTAFEALAPSHRKEIHRYLNSMKTEESLVRNIKKVLQHLIGETPDGLSALMRR